MATARTPIGRLERLEVQYDSKHWKNLKTLRLEAIAVLEILHSRNLRGGSHGSIARGDITERSDIDIFIQNPPSSFRIEEALEGAKIQMIGKSIVQATPYYAIKGYIEIGLRRTISFPLVKMHRVEREFYQFGGRITLQQLKKDQRVMGVDKKLALIEPTEQGHVESSVVGREHEIGKLLGIAAETVLDRVHALTRRNRKGRTGVFVKRQLNPDETFEMALKKLADERPEVRRRLKHYRK